MDDKLKLVSALREGRISRLSDDSPDVIKTDELMAQAADTITRLVSELDRALIEAEAYAHTLRILPPRETLRLSINRWVDQEIETYGHFESHELADFIVALLAPAIGRPWRKTAEAT